MSGAGRRSERLLPAGLSERFDSTIGAGTVLMPFGGKYQNTPIQAMANKISCEHGETDDCSVMAWGFNPFIAEKSPYHGAYLAVAESAAKLVAAARTDVPTSAFRSISERWAETRENWGSPRPPCWARWAQKALGAAAIGGKDSMSGSLRGYGRAAHAGVLRRHHGQDRRVISPTSSRPRGIPVVPLLTPAGTSKTGLPVPHLWEPSGSGGSPALCRAGKVLSAACAVEESPAEAVMPF
jgi:hypothetical protein